MFEEQLLNLSKEDLVAIIMILKKELQEKEEYILELEEC